MDSMAATPAPCPPPAARSGKTELLRALPPQSAGPVRASHMRTEQGERVERPVPAHQCHVESGPRIAAAGTCDALRRPHSTLCVRPALHRSRSHTRSRPSPSTMTGWLTVRRFGVSEELWAGEPGYKAEAANSETIGTAPWTSIQRPVRIRHGDAGRSWPHVPMNPGGPAATP